MSTMLAPVLALVVLSLLVWVAMVGTRIPAMQRLRMHPQSARYTRDLTALPAPTRDIADNYNHLMEQPTIFYAVALAAQVAGHADAINLSLAWAYVAIRVVHTLIQVTRNRVMLRFYAFVASTLVLAVLAVREVVALF